jgi:hypothetical protein
MAPAGEVFAAKFIECVRIDHSQIPHALTVVEDGQLHSVL